MQMKYLIGLITAMALAGVVVILLLQGADLPNRKNNGFTRDIVISFKKPFAQKELGAHVTRISGVTDNRIYFSGNNPEWLFRASYMFDQIDTLGYAVKYSETLRDPNIFVDSPNLYMYAFGIQYLIKGNVDSANVDTLKLESEMITRVAQLSKSKLIVRSIDSTQSRQTFALLDCENGKMLRQNDIFRDQQYGGFEADGLLKYDRISKRIFYVQSFQNRFFCLDTNLNVLYTANTIDTVFSNPVQITLVNENDKTKVMSARPRTIVNQVVAVFNNRIFIVSGLRADNESMSEFRKNFSVDIYNGTDGKYMGSIHVPKLNGKNVLDFQVVDKYWIVLYKGGDCATYLVDEH